MLLERGLEQRLGVKQLPAPHLELDGCLLLEARLHSDFSQSPGTEEEKRRKPKNMHLERNFSQD